jgi:hypothetical protein
VTAANPSQGVKELKFSTARRGMKTGVQSIRHTVKTLDSGFHRNDVRKKQIDFFTASQSLERVMVSKARQFIQIGGRL